MSRRNPLIPTKQEVLAFNPHAQGAFGYNRMLLVDERLRAEVEDLRDLAVGGVLCDTEVRLLNVIDAMMWMGERERR